MAIRLHSLTATINAPRKDFSYYRRQQGIEKAIIQTVDCQYLEFGLRIKYAANLCLSASPGNS
jgi:hypothetical protein